MKRIIIIAMLLFASTIVAKADYVDGYYEWSFDDGFYSNSGASILDTTGRNNATIKEGATLPTISNGTVTLNNSAYYLLDKPVSLAQDKPWRVEWRGKMETGTTSSCQIILGNDNATQYIMYGSNKIFFGNKAKERAELACPRDTVAYKNTSYILEGDGDRHVRLTYTVEGSSESVISGWVAYPDAVGDITLSALFGNYSRILYKGTIDYVRVWEDYPEELIEDDPNAFEADLKFTDQTGAEVRGSRDDLGKSDFFLTGTLKNTSRKSTDNLLLLMGSYDETGRLIGVKAKPLKLSAKQTLTITSDDGLSATGRALNKGAGLKAFLLTNTLSPINIACNVDFDGRFVGSIKMLCIGNSYSIDASTMVHDIAAADGVDINITNLHVGGCTLQMHCDNITNGTSYAVQINGVSNGYSTMEAALKKDSWDYVSIQQGSSESNDFSKYWTEEHPYLTTLADYVKSLSPQSTIVIHQTWPYQNSNAISRLGYSGEAPLARNAMFEDVKAAYRQAANMLGVNTLPSGEAVQYAQNVIGFSEAQMYRDNYSHMTEDKGRYLIGAIWYTFLTGNSIMDNTYQPSTITSTDLAKLKQAVEYVSNLNEYKWR